MDRLAAIEAFAAVAETGSFSAAAARLRASKSAVSRLVSGLEAELGARLLHRTTRSLALTEAGRGYFERVTRILSDVDEANRAVSHSQAAPRGKLRIAGPMSFGFLHLAPALPDFLRQCPEVEIDLAMNDRFVDLIEEGFDIAVRIGALTDSSLVARRLAPIRLVACASPAYLAERGAPATPGDLRAHECLINTNQPQPSHWRFGGPDGQIQSIEVKGRLSANNGDALRVAALNGFGITMLPTFFVGGDLRTGALARVLDDFMPRDHALSAVYPPSRHVSPKVRAFVDFLARRFGPRPYWDAVE